MNYTKGADCTYTQNQANSQMMAAPEMYEALHLVAAKLVGKYGYSEMTGLGNTEWRGIYAQIDAALAKAQGK